MNEAYGEIVSEVVFGETRVLTATIVRFEVVEGLVAPL